MPERGARLQRVLPLLPLLDSAGPRTHKAQLVVAVQVRSVFGRSRVAVQETAAVVEKNRAPPRSHYKSFIHKPAVFTHAKPNSAAAPLD